MHPKPEANRLTGPTEWHAIDWQKAFRLLKNLRSRIFRAAQEGNYKKVRSLQKLMLRSYANRVTSIRRITQLNAGKDTPGVDQIVVRTAGERQKLVEELRQHQPWKAKPARRVYIPKANGKRRPLGIPVIKDRCLQTMVVQALEPEWEAKFEASSYGFRPGRSGHDAIERIFRYARPNSRRKWVRTARRQNYQCPVCKTSLFTGEALHVHHVKPKQEGGSDAYSNLRLVHVTCHQQVHSKAFEATKTKQGTLSRLSSA